MSKPDDIPQDVRELAKDLYVDFVRERQAATGMRPVSGALAAYYAVELVARAILSERNRAIVACEGQRRIFASAEYSVDQPLGTLQERFACDQCIKAIRGPAAVAHPASNDDFASIQVIGEIR